MDYIHIALEFRALFFFFMGFSYVLRLTIRLTLLSVVIFMK